MRQCELQLQGRLNSAMSSLAADHDREVCAAALAVSDLYKQVPVRMAGSTGRATSDSLGGGQQLYDAADAAKEAAEADNLLDPQDLERSGARHGRASGLPYRAAAPVLGAGSRHRSGRRLVGFVVRDNVTWVLTTPAASSMARADRDVVDENRSLTTARHEHVHTPLRNRCTRKTPATLRRLRREEANDKRRKGQPDVDKKLSKPAQRAVAAKPSSALRRSLLLCVIACRCAAATNVLYPDGGGCVQVPAHQRSVPCRQRVPRRLGCQPAWTASGWRRRSCRGRSLCCRRC